MSREMELVTRLVEQVWNRLQPYARVDEALMAELESLAAAGARRFEEAGYLHTGGARHGTAPI